MMFNRIERLKENFLNAKIGIDSERARLVTESYKETEGEPVVVRRARAFEKISKKMTIFIQPYELIVGNLASKPRYVPIFPETGWEWIEEELDGNASTPSFESRPVDTFQVTEETKQELREIFEYWKGKTLQDIMKKLCPEIIKKAIETTTLDNLNLWYSQDGHVSMDYPKVLNKGFAGVIKEAEETLKDLDITDPDFQHKRSFLEAVIICCKAVITYSKRYAKKAKEMITCETSPERKKELEKIAETCNQVPENPARSFYEACQSFFFTHIAVQIMDNGHSISPGRLDQYLYPFY
ncbi:MAG: glycyl radical protein, partial [Flavobacteriaceae bacterium]|nr:glycyl radical protein [Flavobacteriaceae bacterium]